MKSFAIAGAALLLASIPSLTCAAPTQIEERQQPSVVITFSGAGSNPPTYTLTPPFDGRNVTINNPLSVSHISVNVPVGVCRFAGVDGGFEFIVGAGSVDVGPPQVQTSVRCSAFSCIGFPIFC